VRVAKLSRVSQRCIIAVLGAGSEPPQFSQVTRAIAFDDRALGCLL
jgi:hypothetical protein